MVFLRRLKVFVQDQLNFVEIPGSDNRRPQILKTALQRKVDFCVMLTIHAPKRKNNFM